jgi:hypothetical protein
MTYPPVILLGQWLHELGNELAARGYCLPWQAIPAEQFRLLAAKYHYRLRMPADVCAAWLVRERSPWITAVDVDGAA